MSTENSNQENNSNELYPLLELRNEILTLSNFGVINKEEEKNLLTKLNRVKEELRLSRFSNRSCCSKCGKSLSTRWEESACHIKLEIGIDCCSTEALFGRGEKIGFNHPAIKEGSGYQKVFIESRKESDYKLCWSCHRDFVKQVGDFLKNDC